MKGNPPKIDEADVVLRVRGTVQGVGFRPFVRVTASKLRLRGWVLNDAQGVLIRASGPRYAVNALADLIEREPPRASRVETVERLTPSVDTAPLSESFVIVESEVTGLPISTAIPADIALCDDCRAEMEDPSNRRADYPFINCTQCGPRYSIIERIPYDRPATTMRAFLMCQACKTEYEDPESRRFHAQPNACPCCGPRVSIRSASAANPDGRDPFAQASRLILGGAVVAVQGIGGYHLMVDATNEVAVRELRRRKGRDEKPFAVMFPSIESARGLLAMTDEAEVLLRSPTAPIVLVPRGPNGALAPSIAPGNPWVGALIPYSPLHVRLLGQVNRPLVATSANFSEEPLCFTHEDAASRLSAIADAFLEHDRPIAHPIDDSVVRPAEVASITLRRARGLAPSPFRLPAPVIGSLLCVGAQMKNTIGVAMGSSLVLSPHIGDLGGRATREVFERTIETLSGLLKSPITAVACDKHPDYASTLYARHLGLPLVPVQHHLAHVLAVLLENRQGPDGILGISWDGTGYGEDGTIWGGEFILLDKGRARRFARLSPFALPGGEAAIRDGRRTALSLAHAAEIADLGVLARGLGLGNEEGNLIRMIERGINSPLTSSVGRLFDAVGALLGIGGLNRFEGQTPMAVEIAARSCSEKAQPLSLELKPLGAGSGAQYELDWRPLVARMANRRSPEATPAALALGFHEALCQAAVAVARASGVDTVALSGGCFQNALLLDRSTRALRAAGFRVLLHRELPPNDGNIAAGQALAAVWGLSSVDLP